ncbi:S8 family serine peptidase [Actinokineospora sp. HUAS TT18]|uniref:S8 family serine peptidase n=1 Tax=Actinokineospora sp. HUAS TT18 TaxID=3447451 RepID=UPI003F51EAF7
MAGDTPRPGVLSGQSEDPRAFLNRVLDPASGELRLPRTGRVWDAVATAHLLGATGEGRCVAVIDAGFDLSIPTLNTNLHPASRVRAETLRAAKWHGTATALLIRAVAPNARLLLLDIYSPGSLRAGDVGAAIQTAHQSGAQVINLSLEFPTDCPLRDTAWVDVDVLTTPAPPLERYLAQVGAWITYAEPYAELRCRKYCELCTALAAVPDSTLVVAASGNLTNPACPACVDRVVGVGFHRSNRVERDGVVFTTSELPLTEADIGRSELLMEEPPGFLGTSFAAPLLSGLGALVPSPSELADLVRVAKAMAPILLLADAQWRTPADAVPGTLHQGLLRIAEAIPPAHRHFDQEQVDTPCIGCALLLIDWYDVFVAMLVASGVPHKALGLARIASILAPTSPSTAGNHGLAAERAATAEVDPAQREALYDEALSAYERTCRLAPGVSTYAAAHARVRDAVHAGQGRARG